jgi:hypothetical protein
LYHISPKKKKCLQLENTLNSNGRCQTIGKELYARLLHIDYSRDTINSKDNNNSMGVCNSIYTTQATVPAQIRMLQTEGKTTAEGKTATSGTHG